MEFSATTAIVVVDVQHDFADPSGTLFVTGGPATVPVVNELIAEAVDAGATVEVRYGFRSRSRRSWMARVPGATGRPTNRVEGSSLTFAARPDSKKSRQSQ